MLRHDTALLCEARHADATRYADADADIVAAAAIVDAAIDAEPRQLPHISSKMLPFDAASLQSFVADAMMFSALLMLTLRRDYLPCFDTDCCHCRY